MWLELEPSHTGRQTRETTSAGFGNVNPRASRNPETPLLCIHQVKEECLYPQEDLSKNGRSIPHKRERKTSNLSKWPTTDKWINKMRNIHIS